MPQEYHPGNKVKFRWSYSNQLPFHEIEGTIVSVFQDQITVRVVDAKMMDHLFHVMMKDII